MKDELGRFRACSSDMGISSTKREESTYLSQLTLDVLVQISKLVDQLNKNLQEGHFAVSLLLANETSAQNEPPQSKLSPEEETQEQDAVSENDSATPDLENIVRDITHIINWFCRLSQTTCIAKSTDSATRAPLAIPSSCQANPRSSCLGVPRHAEILSSPGVKPKGRNPNYSVMTSRRRLCEHTTTWYRLMKLRLPLSRTIWSSRWIDNGTRKLLQMGDMGMVPDIVLFVIAEYFYFVSSFTPLSPFLTFSSFSLSHVPIACSVSWLFECNCKDLWRKGDYGT